MNTRLIRLSIMRSAQAILGWFRDVHGSKVVKSVAPANVFSASFLSRSVNSACSPGASSPRNACPSALPSRAMTAPTFGEILPGSLLHFRARSIALSMSCLSLAFAGNRSECITFAIYTPFVATPYHLPPGAVDPQRDRIITLPGGFWLLHTMVGIGEQFPNFYLRRRD